MIDRRESNIYFNPDYLSEIMASAIQIIIEKIRGNPGDWEKIMSDRDFLPGSIAQILQYMRQSFDWDFTSPEELAKDIRAYTYNIKGL